MISWKNHTILKQMLYFVLEDQPLVNYLLVDYKRLELTFSNCWSPDQLPECETKKIFFCLRLKSQRSTFWITHSFKLLVFFFPLLLKIIKGWLMAYLTSYDPFYFFLRWITDLIFYSLRVWKLNLGSSRWEKDWLRSLKCNHGPDSHA